MTATKVFSAPGLPGQALSPLKSFKTAWLRGCIACWHAKLEKQQRGTKVVTRQTVRSIFETIKSSPLRRFSSTNGAGQAMKIPFAGMNKPMKSRSDFDTKGLHKHRQGHGHRHQHQQRQHQQKIAGVFFFLITTARKSLAFPPSPVKDKEVNSCPQQPTKNELEHAAGRRWHHSGSAREVGGRAGQGFAAQDARGGSAEGSRSRSARAGEVFYLCVWCWLVVSCPDTLTCRCRLLWRVLGGCCASQYLLLCRGACRGLGLNRDTEVCPLSVAAIEAAMVTVVIAWCRCSW